MILPVFRGAEAFVEKLDDTVRRVGNVRLPEHQNDGQGAQLAEVQPPAFQSAVLRDFAFRQNGGGVQTPAEKLHHDAYILSVGKDLRHDSFLLEGFHDLVVAAAVVSAAGKKKRHILQVGRAHGFFAGGGEAGAVKRAVV